MKRGYKTKDIYLAALIHASGIRYLGCTWEERVCWFLFEDVVACSHLEVEFIGNKVMVKAKSYAESIRTLKGVIRLRTE